MVVLEFLVILIVLLIWLLCLCDRMIKLGICFFVFKLYFLLLEINGFMRIVVFLVIILI